MSEATQFKDVERVGINESIIRYEGKNFSREYFKKVQGERMVGQQMSFNEALGKDVVQPEQYGEDLGERTEEQIFDTKTLGQEIEEQMSYGKIIGEDTRQETPYNVKEGKNEEIQPINNQPRFGYSNIASTNKENLDRVGKRTIVPNEREGHVR